MFCIVQIIRPILRGRDIKRYVYEWAGKWILFIPWHFPNTQNPKSMEEFVQVVFVLFLSEF
ncbi:hypothetical protein Q5I06_08700 [Helicobacter sp. faydin-H76]|uniref:Uncharacterized protein n=1 Tax=Helicobacter cappadocius TaxID=3063998 RepID=A0AA90PXG5_9HELI|nr:hypothetical protein [Helicobacter sp. faydin-H76]MDP2539845.1 hypothetical protein [Helicobacter sp. faydin-H76]